MTDLQLNQIRYILKEAAYDLTKVEGALATRQPGVIPTEQTWYIDNNETIKEIDRALSMIERIKKDGK